MAVALLSLYRHHQRLHLTWRTTCSLLSLTYARDHMWQWELLDMAFGNWCGIPRKQSLDSSSMLDVHQKLSNTWATKFNACYNQSSQSISLCRGRTELVDTSMKIRQKGLEQGRRMVMTRAIALVVCGTRTIIEAEEAVLIVAEDEWIRKGRPEWLSKILSER